MSVIDEIAAERRRQIEQEGWTPEHDDEHGGGVLAAAAACYAIHAVSLMSTADMERRNNVIRECWPWAEEWWKPKGQRRDLIRAAALIVAELERLDRAEDGGER